MDLSTEWLLARGHRRPLAPCAPCLRLPDGRSGVLGAPAVSDKALGFLYGEMCPFLHVGTSFQVFFPFLFLPFKSVCLRPARSAPGPALGGEPLPTLPPHFRMPPTRAQRCRARPRALARHSSPAEGRQVTGHGFPLSRGCVDVLLCTDCFPGHIFLQRSVVEKEKLSRLLAQTRSFLSTPPLRQLCPPLLCGGIKPFPEATVLLGPWAGLSRRDFAARVPAFL